MTNKDPNTSVGPVDDQGYTSWHREQEIRNLENIISTASERSKEEVAAAREQLKALGGKVHEAAAKRPKSAASKAKETR